MSTACLIDQNVTTVVLINRTKALNYQPEKWFQIITYY